MGVVFHFPDSTLAATTTMGIGLVDMILRVASSPPIPGKRMSIAMISGERRSSIRSASSALPAVAHISRHGSRPMLYSSSARRKHMNKITVEFDDSGCATSKSSVLLYVHKPLIGYRYDAANGVCQNAERAPDSVQDNHGGVQTR